jgi:hypothetical protein
LDKGMLDVPRMFSVVKVFADLLVGKVASEPGAPPKQEGHQHDQPSDKKEQEAIPSGHVAAGGRCLWRCNVRNLL